MEFGKVKEVVRGIGKDSWDEFHPPTRMEFHNFDTLTINNTLFNIADSAKRLIGQRLRIPAPYIARCPPKLQAENLNYWLGTLSQSAELFCRFKGNTLRAVFTECYKPTDNIDILNQLNIPENTKCIFRIDNEMMQLSIPDSSNTFSVINDDEMMPGVCLTNSEVGLKAFSISAYYLRIVCTNGMLATTLFSQSYRHISTRGIDNFRGTLEEVTQRAVQNSDQFKLAADKPVEDPINLIASLGRHYQLTKRQIKQIQNFYEPPDTMWSVINAFTAAANDYSLSVEKSNQLQLVGGRILSMVR